MVTAENQINATNFFILGKCIRSDSIFDSQISLISGISINNPCEMNSEEPIHRF
jgi:hypothetical protein